MKAISMLLAPLAVSAAVLDTRQLGGKLSGLTAKDLKVAWTRDLKPEVRPDAVHKIIGFGPIALKGNMKGKQQNFLFSIKNGFCQSCTVLKGKAGIEIKGDLAKEEKAIYVHHILTSDVTKQQQAFIASCTANNYTEVAGKSASGTLSMGSKFIGTGDDQAGIYTWYTARDAKVDAGFQVGQGDNFVQNVDLVSNVDEPAEVYITMELEYLPGHVGVHTRDVLLNVGGCSRGGVNLSETGPTNTTSGKFFFHEDGSIIFAKGHLHAGGEVMLMYINDKLVCESKASYDNGPKGTITNMGICPSSINVKKGDYLTMTAVYDASKHQVRHDHGMGGGAGGMPDVMGMWAIAFASSAKS